MNTFPETLSQSPDPSAEILRSCAAVDGPAAEEPWRRFIDLHEPTLRRGIRRGCHLAGIEPLPQGDLEDLIQEVYCRLLDQGRRRLRHCRGSHHGSISAYLHRLAVRVVLDRHRRRRTQRRGAGWRILRERQSGQLEGLHGGLSSDPATLHERRDLIRACLRRYGRRGPRHRRDVQVWLLATAGGYTHREIVRLWPGPLTISQVAKAVRRIRRVLPALIAELGEAQGSPRYRILP